MRHIITLLHQAIINGDIVSIIYNGGSHPGKSRKLIPLSVTDEDLKAMDPSARIPKTFKLNKIASASLLSGVGVSNPNVAPVVLAEIPQTPAFETLAEYAAYLAPEFREAGWNMIETDDFLGVGTFFKNGKPRKSTNISIQFCDRSIETVFDWESGETSAQPRILNGRERPWVVSSWHQQQSKSFTQLQRAMDAFVKEVRASSPVTINPQP